MAEPRDLEQWTTELVAALDLDTSGLDPRGSDARGLDASSGAAGHDARSLGHGVDIAGVLDLARVAAHQVARPAAPLTTFLAGFALARGATLEQVADVVARLAGVEAEAEAAKEPR